ncbi:MAG: hypothetical protein ABUL62_05160 [Myxococcales bacterium]
MGRAMHHWTRGVCGVLMLSSFLACKKKSDEPAPAASVSPAAELAAAAAASAAAAQAAAAANAAAAQAAAAGAPATVDAGAAPVLGEVKRFADKEKVATGNTKILVDASKIYDEPDASKPSVALLNKDLVVTRLATLGTEWTLVEFPSGVGKVSPGWIESKSLVGGGGVTSTVANAKPTTSAAPAASASAKPAATAAASAAPAATTTASAAPKPRTKPGAILRAPGR